MPKGPQQGTDSALEDAWTKAGSPELDKEGEADEEDALDIPLEGDELDELPLEEEAPAGQAATPESGPSDALPEGVPATYFGKDIAAYAKANGAEAAKAYHGALVDATKDYNRRLEEFAEERKQSEATPKPTAQEENEAEESVDDILHGLGFNMENPYAQEIKDDVLAPLARSISEIRSTQADATTASEAATWEAKFHGQLEALQTKHGNLGLEREQIAQLAIENEIFNPSALYWSIAGPLREAELSVQTKATKTAKTAADETVNRVKKSAARPKGRRSPNSKAQEAPVKRGSMEDAARAAARTLGRPSIRFEK